MHQGGLIFASYIASILKAIQSLLHAFICSSAHKLIETAGIYELIKLKNMINMMSRNHWKSTTPHLESSQVNW